LLAVLAAFWIVDATFMCAMALGDITLASSMLRVGIDIALLLITVIGGRIVPAFTASELRGQGTDVALRTSRLIDTMTIASMIGILIADAFVPTHSIAALAAALAAVFQAVRLAGWQSLRTLRAPIVWVLHLAYAWMPVGLALKAIHLSTGVDWAADWLHALTIGAAALMVVAVVTRASLGHTGRPLVVSKWVAGAYLLLGAAALVRVSATQPGMGYPGVGAVMDPCFRSASSRLRTDSAQSSYRRACWLKPSRTRAERWRNRYEYHSESLDRTCDAPRRFVRRVVVDGC
jgi:uncharacterized protein involved in response to NO